MPEFPERQKLVPGRGIVKTDLTASYNDDVACQVLDILGSKLGLLFAHVEM